MTDASDGAPTRRWSAPAVLRQPVVHGDRSVFAWALRADPVPQTSTDGPHQEPEEIDQAIDSEYALLDLQSLSGGLPVLIRATRGLLSGRQKLDTHGVEVVLEIPPALLANPALGDQIATIRAAGGRLALADYTGDPAQDALLDDVHIVKVTAHTSGEHLTELIAHARSRGATVIAEHSGAHSDIQRSITAGADLLQGPMFERDSDVLAPDLTAGELQCLELMSLLSDDPVDQASVIGLVAADPMLTVRVLHLVNSSSFGLPREVDSVRQAVVLVGPHHLAALAISSLVGAQPSNVAELWAIITRALACWDLSGSDAGYTVGLLSAVSEQRHLPMESLVSRTGVSQEVADALYFHNGSLGEALAAIIAHEANDIVGVMAAGKDPRDVSHAFLGAVPEALAIASSLAVEPPEA